MRFEKGHVPWIKGKKMSLEFCQKIGLRKKGIKQSQETIEKRMSKLRGENHWTKRKSFSNETREKMRIAKLGIPQKQEHIDSRVEGRKGYRHSSETKRKIGESRKGTQIWKNKPHPRGMLGKSSKFRGMNFCEIYGLEKADIIKKKIAASVNLAYVSNPKIIDKIKEERKKQITPKKDTSIEVKIQNYLKQLGIEFFTHQYIKEIEHGYQCDILIPSINLVIECDGDYWHKYPIGRDIDHVRTSELLENGFKVLRLWECEINQMSLEAFKNKISQFGAEI